MRGVASLDGAELRGAWPRRSWIAAAAEVRGFRWFGRPELRSRGLQVPREDGARHVPDLAYVAAGRRTAVEVELHLKDRSRLRAILRGYGEPHARRPADAVSYVTGETRSPRWSAAKASGLCSAEHSQSGRCSA